ncbi:glutathione S-transferase U9-like [Carica papaya]|uniref:glutathione S-transferase U9-like n=1 Tax=Carica papaya TaxID=3649 RepID=UPI000B8D07B4|nr:glutathione S-transferase U9-like [Carica papaya]
MSEENKLILHGTWSSPYYKTVELALKLKGIPFEYVEEDLKNKSQKILTYNPVYKKIPVLVHTGKPISESLVIVEYVDETWKNGPPLLPQNPYSRAQVRFWVSFIRDQLYKTMFAVIQTQGEEQEKAVEELLEKLGVLEDGLKEFFPNIGNLSFGNGKPISESLVIPVLVHTGKPISESLVIVEYVDETWKNGPPLLPQNPYSRAQVRFWVSFIRDQLYKTMFAVIQTQGEEQEKAVEELLEKLGVLEDGLKEFFPNIGNLSFGNGDMGLLDIAMGVVFGPYRVQEQVAGVKIIDPDKTPLIFSWLNAISKHPVVVDSTPPLDKMVAMLKIFRQNALSSSAT